MNSSFDEAFNAACRKLASRMRTEKEIRLHLKKLEFDDDTIDEVVSNLTEFGYIDDEKYCAEYFKYAKTKGKADARIVRELVEKGLTREMAKNVIDDVRESATEMQREMTENDGESTEFVLTDYRTDEYSSDSRLAYEIGLKMTKGQLEEGKEIDQKFIARVGRRLAGLGYDSGIVYNILGKLREYGRKKSGSVSEDEATYR